MRAFKRSPIPRLPGTSKQKPRFVEARFGKNTGKAPTKVIPNYGSLNRGAPSVVGGPCSSCRCREGQTKLIHGHAGRPVLCELCADRRRARVARNRQRHFLVALSMREGESLD